MGWQTLAQEELEQGTERYVSLIKEIAHLSCPVCCVAKQLVYYHLVGLLQCKSEL